MPALSRLLAAGALSLIAAGPAQAARVTAVEVHGLDERMTDNVRVSLSLVEAIGEEVSARRLSYLLDAAQRETREALEPFGYYSPTVTVDPARADADEDTVAVQIRVVLGEPVTVRRAHVVIEGAGGRDKYLRADLAEFTPQAGEVFDHARYEASKARITRRLAERGYFDADFASRQVEVTRAQRAADIDLVWTSGERYDMGPTTITQTPRRIIREGLLERLVYWEEGSYYHQGKLDRLRESLARLDYFASIDIEPHPEDAVDGRVPVTVTLTPARRTIYTAGLGYGTDSGPGVRLGLERRYLGDRGHKLLTQLDWADKRKSATVQYRVPAFARAEGWYTVSAQFYDEQSDYLDTRRVELVGSRSGQVSERLNVAAALHALRERWAYPIEDDGNAATPIEYRYATFLYPSLRAEYVNADNRVFPRDALGLTVELRSGVQLLASDANFLQAYGIGHWYRGVGRDNRLIVRTEAGYTFTNELIDMPPSLRFYAGGDRSIRGYGFREVGPRVLGTDGRYYALGAKNVLTGSLEFEHYFNERWGAAVFVDAGDAFDDTPDLHTGVGLGARWRSPVGPVRLDVAHGLDQPDSPYELHLNIGVDL